eukprot:959219-Amphidinium_carterae.1
MVHTPDWLTTEGPPVVDGVASIPLMVHLGCHTGPVGPTALSLQIGPHQFGASWRGPDSEVRGDVQDRDRSAQNS